MPHTLQLTWWDIGDRQGCRQHRSDERSPQWTGCCAGRIPILGSDTFLDSTKYEAKAPYHEHNTSKITSDLQVSLGHLLTVGNDNGASLASCGPLVHDPIAVQQTLNLPSLLTM